MCHTTQALFKLNLLAAMSPRLLIVNRKVEALICFAMPFAFFSISISRISGEWAPIGSAARPDRNPEDQALECFSMTFDQLSGLLTSKHSDQPRDRCGTDWLVYCLVSVLAIEYNFQDLKNKYTPGAQGFPKSPEVVQGAVAAEYSLGEGNDVGVVADVAAGVESLENCSAGQKPASKEKIQETYKGKASDCSELR